MLLRLQTVTQNRKHEDGTSKHIHLIFPNFLVELILFYLILYYFCATVAPTRIYASFGQKLIFFSSVYVPQHFINVSQLGNHK